MKADIELVEDLKAGDQLAFSQLVERHQQSLLRLCFRFMKDLNRAEDVVQEAFIKSYQKIHTFEGRSSFKSWLFQIAVNISKNHLRSLKSKAENTTLENVHISVNATVDTKIEENDVKKLVMKYVETLPEKQKTALMLRVFEDLSFKEIAQIMKCPYDTAKANYRHAVMKLRHTFAEDDFLKDWDAPKREVKIKYKFTEV